MSGSAAALRVLCDDATRYGLHDDSATGTLRTASAVLGTVADLEIGLWEAAPGHGDDVESDEVFVVLEGRGTVEFHDGSRIALRPGTVVRLHEGDRTTWSVDERLRKLYLA